MNKLYDRLKNENINAEVDAPVCLISGHKLLPNHVMLKCGHAFNSEPLWQSLYDQINKFHTFYTYSLSPDEIDLLLKERRYDFFKCPYCKTIHFGKPDGFDNIFERSIFVSPSYVGANAKCNGIIKSGKNKGQQCTCNILPSSVKGVATDIKIKYDFSSVPFIMYCGRHNTKK